MENFEKNTKRRKQTGNSGEEKSASFLMKNGYDVIFRNFRTRNGEIDIIAIKQNVLAFVEVKTFPLGTRELLGRVLSERKQN